MKINTQEIVQDLIELGTNSCFRAIYKDENNYNVIKSYLDKVEDCTKIEIEIAKRLVDTVLDSFNIIKKLLSGDIDKIYLFKIFYKDERRFYTINSYIDTISTKDCPLSSIRKAKNICCDVFHCMTAIKELNNHSNYTEALDLINEDLPNHNKLSCYLDIVEELEAEKLKNAKELLRKAYLKSNFGNKSE